MTQRKENVTLCNDIYIILARTFRSRTRGYLNNNAISRFSGYAARGNRNNRGGGGRGGGQQQQQQRNGNNFNYNR